MKNTSEMYLDALQLKGNTKLLDYCDPTTGAWYKYAQFNTKAGACCPFASMGCAIACYAKHGLHQMPSVKAAREKSYAATLCPDFADKMVYTIEANLESRRYKGATMILRLHESGDFYSREYLQKWVQVFAHFKTDRRVVFCFYTKSFAFFLDLDDEQKTIIRECMENGTVAASLSIDDTTDAAQLHRAELLRREFPLVNTFYCTDNVEGIAHDNVCECANCAKCGHCTHATGKLTACHIHSVTPKQLEKYQSRKRAVVEA